MAAKLDIVVFVLVFCSAAHPVENEQSPTTEEVPGGCGFGYELLITKLEMLEQKITKLDILQQELTEMKNTMEKQTKSVFRSCSEVPTKISGKYQLQPDVNGEQFAGFCEQEKHGGGWLVIQHRFDGSVNFYRDWKEYKNGFGKIDGEFWIGLERLHKMTKYKTVTLLVEIEDYDGNYRFGIYNSFEIGSETEKYVLKRLGEYAGTTEDSMRVHEGRMFTTRDSDNDNFNGNCAHDEGGAWWYTSCGNTNPNGPFHKQEAPWKKIYWYKHRTGVELKFFRMMIR